jgi:hypothetical protein
MEHSEVHGKHPGMGAYIRPSFLLALFFLLPSFTACRPEAVEYQAIDDLTNPGRGWTTFYSLNGGEQNR